MKIFGK